VKNSYQVSIFHLFFATFKISRLSQEGGIIVDESGSHHVSYSMIEPDRPDNRLGGKTRADKDVFRRAGFSLLGNRDEFYDGITL
jgi:terephthalate 1,2-dioxygenase oxygenase component alpha subunit